MSIKCQDIISELEERELIAQLAGEDKLREHLAEDSIVEEYVRSGDHLEAAKKAGYKDTHTLRNQACKLRRECAEEISEELHRNFAEIAPRALNILSDLAENAESESVRLGATRDLLDRAGFRPVDRHEVVKEKSVEELNAQLVSLVGDDGAQMLISAFKSRRSITGPELAG